MSFLEIQYFYVQSIIEIPKEVDERFLGKIPLNINQIVLGLLFILYDNAVSLFFRWTGYELVLGRERNPCRARFRREEARFTFLTELRFQNYLIRAM